MNDTPRTTPPPTIRTRRRVALPFIAGAAAAVGLLCCGWLALQLVGGLLDELVDLWFVLLPVALLAAIVLSAVLGWRFGVLRRWSKTRVVVVTLAVIVAAPAVLFGGWIIKATVDAGEGADCPLCAVDHYVWNVLDDPIRLRNFLCTERRDQLADQATQWRDTYLAALARWELTARLEAAASQHDVRGDQASATTPVIHTHEQHWSKHATTASSKQVPWRFELVNDNGWRVCAVELPDVCTQLIKCDGPPPTQASPSPQPSYRPWSDWDTRIPWQCFPDAGVFARTACPSPPQGWVQPGPAYCAPTYPPLVRAPEKAAHCRELGWDVS